MKRFFLVLSILLVLSTCKKEDDPTVVVNASVADSSMGSIDFKAGSYAVGAAVTFSATPQTGYTFVSWTDSSTNQTYSNNPLTLNPDQNTNLVANFEKTAYNININVTGNGEVQKQVVGGGTSFTHGASVELTAVPADQYSFFYWDNDPSDTTNPKTITLDGNKDVSAKFDYEVAKNLVGDWEFEIGGDSSAKDIKVIRMAVDINLNVLMTTLINGVVQSKIFTKITPISPSSIVIGDFALMTNINFASPTNISMKMASLPANKTPPKNESEISDISGQLNISGAMTKSISQRAENGLIIPPFEAVTASSTTEQISDIFKNSFLSFAGTITSTVASETGSSTSTLSGQSFLDRVNGKMFSSVKNEYTAVFTFTNDLQGEFVKFSMIYDDCSETLINGSNIGEITKNTENELWFTFSIDPQNSDSARGDTLHTAKLSFEDRSGTSSDQDYNDISIQANIALNLVDSGLKTVNLSITSVSSGAKDNLSLQISSNVCNATIIDGESISGGNRRIEQNVCLGENIQSYNLQFNKLRGFDSLINTPLGTGNLAPLPRLLPVRITLKDGSVVTSQNAGTYSNYYGIEYKCNVDNSAINSDNDAGDCDISDPVWGGSGKLSYIYTGVITDTTVSSVHHTIQYGEGIISFITRVKPESECNSPTTDTTTSTTGTATPSGGGGNTGTTSSTGGGGSNTGTTTSTNNCSTFIRFDQLTYPARLSTDGSTVIIEQGKNLDVRYISNANSFQTNLVNSPIEVLDVTPQSNIRELRIRNTAPPGLQLGDPNYHNIISQSIIPIGTYPYTITVSDTNGCSASISGAIQVIASTSSTTTSTTGTTTSTTTTNTTGTSTSTNTGTTTSTGGGGNNSGTTTSTTGTTTSTTGTTTPTGGGGNTGTTTSTGGGGNTGTTTSTGGGGNNSGTTTSTSSSIYFENGTCKCPNASVGDTATISGTLYTVVDNSSIAGQIANGNVNLCTTKVTNMNDLFKDNNSFNSYIGFWDTSNVHTMSNMFNEARNFNNGEPASFSNNYMNWDTSKVTNMYRAFNNARAFNGKISSWDVSKVTNMFYMFASAISFNQNIGGWNVSNVTNMGGLFFYANSFNQDIGGWNTSNVTDMGQMFLSNPTFNQDIGSWDTSNVLKMQLMFKDATAFNQDLSSWCVLNVQIANSTSTPEDFSRNSALTNTNKPVWGTCPSSFTINVTASNASDYTLSGTDRNGNVSGNDPSVTIKVGDTVNFAVNAPGHPFYLKTVQGTGTANTISGVTNNGTTNGTVSWTPTQAGTYYYICSLHAGMVGTITVN